MWENVELVRRWYALLRDLRDADPDEDPAFVDRMFRDFLDEEFELRFPGDYPEGESVFRGREGVAQVLAMNRDLWAELRFEPERFFDAGDRVVAFVRAVAKGNASGVTLEWPVAHPWTIHEARATSVRIYLDRSEVLEAVVLKPD